MLCGNSRLLVVWKSQAVMLSTGEKGFFHNFPSNFIDLRAIQITRIQTP